MGPSPRGSSHVGEEPGIGLTAFSFTACRAVDEKTSAGSQEQHPSSFKWEVRGERGALTPFS